MDRNSISVKRPDLDDSDDAVDKQAKPALIIQADRQGIVAVMLSLGVTAALITFVVEAFLHPNEANILIPLIAAPVGAAIISLIRKPECPNCKDTPPLACPTCKDSTDAIDGK